MECILSSTCSLLTDWADWIKSYIQIGLGEAAPAKTGINTPEQGSSQCCPSAPIHFPAPASPFQKPWLLPSAVPAEMPRDAQPVPPRHSWLKESSQQGWQSTVRSSSSAQHPSSLEKSPSTLTVCICRFLTLNLSGTFR